MNNTANKRSSAELKNGVDLDQLTETISAVKQQPELALFKFRAKNAWIEGGHNRVSVKEYFGQGRDMGTSGREFTFDADEPPVLLGNDLGANPVEFVLAALSACTTTSMIYHGSAQGINFEKVESSYEGDIDLKGFLGINPEVRNGYKEIRVNFKVKSDGDKEALQELMRKSPVFDVISNPTPIKISVTTE